MRTLHKNKWKTFWIGSIDGTMPTYQLDAGGNIEYMDIGGEKVPIEIGTQTAYKVSDEPFKSNFSSSGGDAEAEAYGIDASAYSAKLIAKRGEVSIDETTILWDGEKPSVDADSHNNGSTADWRVVRVVPSQNLTAYLLDKILK